MTCEWVERTLAPGKQHGWLRYHRYCTCFDCATCYATCHLQKLGFGAKMRECLDLGESPSPSQRLRALVAGLVTGCGWVLPTAIYGKVVTCHW
jgi:hypothetical protein